MKLLLSNYSMAVSPPECLPSAVVVTASIEFDDDLTELLPYLNAELGPGVYEPGVPFLRFKRQDHPVAIYPKKIFIASLRDEDEAKEVFEWVREAVNSVSRRKEDIKPSYWSLSQVKPLEVFKLLPRTNCGQCGKSTCMAFAAAIAAGEAEPKNCPAMLDEWTSADFSKLLKLLNKG